MGTCQQRMVRAARMASLGLMAILLTASLGCGTKAERKSSAAPASTGAGESKSSSGSKTARTTKAASTTRQAEAPAAGPMNHVRLTQKVCIQFEPHWAVVQTGQSVTWHSDLKTAVTIHVSGGAFSKSSFVVKPGATVSSGPALGPGSFSIWCEPAACQGAPLGVRGSGPGVTVEAGGE